jgi:riboflavin kinase/FMN adenylyltransferase
MIVLHDGDVPVPSTFSSVVAIGVFDGLHLGHQRVIAKVRRMADDRDALAMVVTFDPHPAWVLAPDRAPLLLGTIEQRLEGFEALGIDRVRILHFDSDLAGESAVGFIERVLIDELRAVQIVVGRDFRFGHDREGDVSLLEAQGAQRGFKVFAAPIYGAAARWSSTVVRRALADGDLELANATLGRPFVLRGTVVHGDARGGDLGFPTANLELGEHQQVPQTGVYAGAARVAGSWWPAAISIGTRQQFYEHGALLVEVNLAGFDGDLYAATLDVAFLGRLRDQTAFAGVPQLVTQIELDVEQSLEIFKKFSPESSALIEWNFGQRR